MRWGVLLIVSLIMAANYYFYDALSPLKDKYADPTWVFQISNMDFCNPPIPFQMFFCLWL